MMMRDRHGFGVIAMGLVLGWLFAVTPLEAQVQTGIRLGGSVSVAKPRAAVVNDARGLPLYRIEASHIGVALNGGLFLQLRFGPFALQPEVYYQWSTANYSLDSLGVSNGGRVELQETYRGLEVPVLLWLKSGFLRVGGGPVLMLALNNEEAFGSYEGIDESYETTQWGIQAGLGFDFWKLHLGARYATPLRSFGSHLSANGRALDFGTRDHRIMAVLSFSF